MAAKRKTTKKATAKKKSIKNLSQTHGKEEKFEPTTLDQIWGDDGLSAYGTMQEEQYEGQIDDMNMSDLQAHASTVGIIPIDNRSTLRERLMREFRKHVNSFKKPVDASSPSGRPGKEAMKILSEGR
tara:strand:- start:475 stop:855 length:381 start_codon:yes stop_codon:yes gene_type:complete